MECLKEGKRSQRESETLSTSKDKRSRTNTKDLSETLEILSSDHDAEKQSGVWVLRDSTAQWAVERAKQEFHLNGLINHLGWKIVDRTINNMDEILETESRTYIQHGTLKANNEYCTFWWKYHIISIPVK